MTMAPETYQVSGLPSEWNGNYVLAGNGYFYAPEGGPGVGWHLGGSDPYYVNTLDSSKAIFFIVLTVSPVTTYWGIDNYLSYNPVACPTGGFTGAVSGSPVPTFGWNACTVGTPTVTLL